METGRGWIEGVNEIICPSHPETRSTLFYHPPPTLSPWIKSEGGGRGRCSKQMGLEENEGVFIKRGRTGGGVFERDKRVCEIESEIKQTKRERIFYHHIYNDRKKNVFACIRLDHRGQTR